MTGYMDMAKRAMLKAGYRCFNGTILNDYDVNMLNTISEEINRFIDAGLPVSEEILNRSHHAFCMAARVYK